MIHSLLKQLTDCNLARFIVCFYQKKIKQPGKAKLFIRHSFQYHWRNNQYTCFDDFLSELKGKKRRQIIKEKRSKEQGLQIKLLPAEQIDEKLAKNFFQFYLSTVKKYSFAYLTEFLLQTLRKM